MGSFLQNAAGGAAASHLQNYVNANQPVIRDWNSIYPYVNDPPGPPFQPQDVPTAIWMKGLSESRFRSIALPPGDYSFAVHTYCMHFSGGSQPSLTYFLAPLRGTRAQMITQLIGRAAVRHAPTQSVQVLAWNLQTGMTYDQLPEESRALFDELLPDFRTALGPGPIAEARRYWDTVAKTIPGVPSFDATVEKLGAASAILASYQSAQSTMNEYGDNYQELYQHLITLSLGGTGNTTVIKPWSVVSHGIYERMITTGYAIGEAHFQIRILRDALAPGTRTVAAPITSLVAYPLSCRNCQIAMSEPDGTFNGILVAQTSFTAGAGSDRVARMKSPGAATAHLAYVTNNPLGGQGPYSAEYFAANAQGDAAPLGIISGPHTGLNGANGIVVDHSGTIWIANATSNTITAYPAGSNGDVAPSHTIGGPNTQLSAPLGLAIDGSDNIYVAQSNAVLVFEAGSDGNVRPTDAIEGPNTQLDGADGIAVDSQRNIFVTNRGAHEIAEYRAGASGDLGPFNSITGLDDLAGIGIDRRDNVYVRLNDFAIAVFAHGAAGNAKPLRVISAKGARLNYPDGLFVTSSGLIYTANRHGDAITRYFIIPTGQVYLSGSLAGPNTQLDGPAFVFVR